MEKKVYIAYGSNMSLEQMAERCAEAEPIGSGVLVNWRLLYAGSKTGSYATIRQEQGYCVPVTLWLISDQDEQHLDRYEGCPVFYKKTEIPFVYRDGTPGKGIVYIMDEQRLVCPTSKWYQSVLVEAYNRHGFDMRVLADAQTWSKKHAGHKIKTAGGEARK